MFGVRPRRKKPRCGGCGKCAPGYDQREARQWWHLNLGATRIWLRYAPRRVECARCGVVNEQVPWGSAADWFSATFEETTAYLARVADKTSVTKIMGIAWVTVGRIVERIVGERLDCSRLDDLHFIGIDEFSYRKRHHYITVIVDHLSGRVVWAAQGRSSETLAAFFRELGPERARKIELVTLDLGRGLHQSGHGARPAGPDRLRSVPRSASGLRCGRPGSPGLGSRRGRPGAQAGDQGLSLRPAAQPVELDRR